MMRAFILSGFLTSLVIPAKASDITRSPSDTQRPTASHALTAEWARELRAKAADNREKWFDRDVWTYQYTLDLYCYCGHGLSTGPNRVSFDFSKGKTVSYIGDNPEPRSVYIGPVDFVLEYGIIELFDEVEQHIQRGTELRDYFEKNGQPELIPLLRVEFDPDYGFPTLISWDEPQTVDDERTLSVTDFSPQNID